MRQNVRVATADPFAQIRLLDLQECDTHLDQIAHRRANLSEAVRLREAESQLTRVKTLIVAGETEVSDRERDVRKMENDVEQVRMRARKDQEMLDGGSITNSKQLEELQHEVTSLKRRQEALEDDELALLEGLEDARKSLATHLEERARLDVELNDARDDLARVEKALDAEHATVTQQRADIAKEIPDDLLRAYDKIRVDNGGVGAALLQHGRCGGCRLQITANELARIKAAPSNEVLRCEECRRIMVRTGESGL
jgi:predicted  nucleic acid-binding Zn-ribbon protein